MTRDTRQKLAPLGSDGNRLYRRITGLGTLAHVQRAKGSPAWRPSQYGSLSLTLLVHLDSQRGVEVSATIDGGLT